VLALLLFNRHEFRASSDLPSTRSAALWLVSGVAAITVASTVATELFLRFDHDRPRLALWRVGEAVVERLVGVQSVALPDRLNDFLAPSLLAIGFAIAVVALLLATRPLVDRSRSAGHAAWAAARDIVRRHGDGTLDYFGLRSDKQWFFHRDSLVAYAIYGGICLVSPDPIGPRAEREQIWDAFRRFADNRGWVVATMGGSEDWLPVYRATGMHDIYIGDEAVVDVQRFSLAGGHMKGLRQAHNRIAKYGYTASFHDPGRLDRQTAERLTGLMSQSRRGEFERGFSMMLGRIFDPRDEGLLLCVVTGPDGAPAAMCQFVPARGIGGFSLDLMRRDRGEHPNGLIDFALVSTIQHLRERGCHGLSLNFAALRSVLEGERGDGVTQRVERWAIKKMSSFFQIETLWHFNAKYGPDWLPRYVVYDTAEHLVPVLLAILRAESLAEVPVIGRMIAASDRRARLAVHGVHKDDTGISLLPQSAEHPEK
jgi:lysyl-tRNA synthetase class 2